MANKDNTSSLGNFRSLRYPTNVGTEQVPAYIRFVPQKVEYGGTKGLNPANRPALSYGNTAANTSSQNKGSGSLSDALKAAKKNLQAKIGGAVESFATAAKTAIQSIGDAFSGTSFTQTAAGLGKIVSGKINLGLFNINLGTKTEKDTITSLGSINLYLPSGLGAQSSVNYSNKEIGQGGIAAAEKFKGDLQTLTMGDMKDVAGNIIIDKIKGAVSQSSFGALIPFATGKVLNNFTFAIFEGVAHRKFSYSFKMIPKDEKESKEIKTICDTFLFLMLPGRSQVNLFNINNVSDPSTNQTGPKALEVQFYDVPCQWQIEYHYLGKKMSYHLQPSACFLESVDVKYNGQTENNLYTDGSPMEIELTLNFVEIEPMYRGNNAIGG